MIGHALLLRRGRPEVGHSSWLNRNRGWLATVGIFLVLLILILGVEESSDRPLFTMPRAASSYELARSWVDTGKPSVALTVPDGTSTELTNAFGPRDALILDGEIRPRDFPVNMALLAMTHLAGDWVLYALGALSGAAAIALVWAIAIRLGADRFDAALAVLVFATSVAFLGNVTALGSFDVTGVAVFLLGVYGMFRLDPGAERWWFWAAISGGSFAIVVGLRYPYILVVAVVYLAVLIANIFPPRVHFVAFGAFALVVLAIAIYHTWLYGGPLMNGYSLDDADSGSVILSTTAGQTLSVLGRHIRDYVLGFEMVIPLVLGAGGMVIAARRGRTVASVVAVGLAAGLGVYTVVNGATPLWGSDVYTVNASFLRYIIALFAIASAFGSLALGRIPSALKFVLVGSIVLMSLSGAVLYNGGLLNRAGGVDEATQIREVVLGATTENSIVMTRSSEKLLWPDRQTFLISYLVDRPDLERSRWVQIPDANSLAAMASVLNASGLEVFVLDYGGWASSDYLMDLDNSLASLGLRRDINAKGDSWVLHAVTHRGVIAASVAVP